MIWSVTMYSCDENMVDVHVSPKTGGGEVVLVGRIKCNQVQQFMQLVRSGEPNELYREIAVPLPA